MAKRIAKVQSPSGLGVTAPGWKARRRGVRFCAPRCGRGCTIHEYRAAVTKADAMAKVLGNGWVGVVWENLGWHAKAVHPVGLEVSALGPGTYWVTTTTGAPQFHHCASTPLGAMKMLAKDITGTIERAQKVLDRVSRSIARPPRSRSRKVVNRG